MRKKRQPVHFLESVVVRGNSSLPLRSSFTLKILPDSDRERDGGFILKGADRGRTLLKVKADHLKGDVNLIFCAQQIIFEKFNIVARKIDGVVSKRIIEYVERYYNKYRTNCATFVEYLRAGIFTEYSEERDQRIFSTGMNLFTTQKIEPGDSLCVLYYRKEVMGRHELLREIRKRCQKNRKHTDLTRLGNKKKLLRPFSAMRIANLCQSTVYSDYHFLFCIGIDNGEPILIHQLGLIEPEEQKRETPAIVISVGTTNLYTNYTPAYMFIKKGRQKKS